MARRSNLQTSTDANLPDDPPKVGDMFNHSRLIGLQSTGGANIPAWTADRDDSYTVPMADHLKQWHSGIVPSTESPTNQSLHDMDSPISSESNKTSISLPTTSSPTGGSSYSPPTSYHSGSGSSSSPTTTYRSGSGSGSLSSPTTYHTGTTCLHQILPVAHLHHQSIK